MAFSNFHYFKQISNIKPTYLKLATQLSNARTFSCCKQHLTKSQVVKNNDNSDADDVNKPIEFMKSDAAQWKAQVSRSGGIETAPWYQPYVITISLSIFMIYFFILREESDIDHEFNRNLFDHISGLEEQQLNVVLEYNKSHNLPTADIETRLSEIRNSK